LPQCVTVAVRWWEAEQTSREKEVCGSIQRPAFTIERHEACRALSIPNDVVQAGAREFFTALLMPACLPRSCPPTVQARVTRQRCFASDSFRPRTVHFKLPTESASCPAFARRFANPSARVVYRLRRGSAVPAASPRAAAPRCPVAVRRRNGHGASARRMQRMRAARSSATAA